MKKICTDELPNVPGTVSLDSMAYSFREASAGAFRLGNWVPPVTTSYVSNDLNPFLDRPILCYRRRQHLPGGAKTRGLRRELRVDVERTRTAVEQRLTGAPAVRLPPHDSA